ncbi:major facilitator superfamily domain-containing protein [Polychytrium aggregatum]|uniref:major facilitator superfamily domain-containing protein n=1 Tax=Polychytrium aggregatum TaxID=110093 RepID=UPI0022FF1F22|nr:major facilitator superfamily domain-containing protein [Polychytrium aggregatum]KAI9209434.1 major facilitator superfamily domain-containing protein [Polychytrium aggregatum]
MDTRIALRSVTLITGFLIMLVSGALFAFSSIGEDLETRFQYTSQQVNFISAFGNAALYLCYLAVGPIYDARGPVVTMIVGAVTFGAGFLCMSLAYDGSITGGGAGYGAMAFYYFVCGFGSTAVYMAALAVNMANFPITLGGMISGSLGLAYALSATLYSQIRASYYAQDVSGYLHFVTVSVFAVSIAGAFSLFKVPLTMAEQARPKGPEKVQVVVADKFHIGSTNTIDERSHIIQPRLSATKQAPWGSKHHLGADDEAMTASPKRVSVAKPGPAPEVEGMTPLEILKSPLFHIYATICIFQQGLTYYSNVATIVQALHPNTDTASSIATHVTILSIAGCFGRLGFGGGSDVMIKYLRLDRSLLLLVATVIQWIPLFILGFGGNVSDGALMLCSVMVGVGYGASGSLFPALIADFFGFKSYGTASAFTLIGCPVGIFLSNMLFGYFNDRATQQNCSGSACYQSAFIVFVGLQAVTVLLSCALYWKRGRDKRRALGLVHPM